MADDTKKPDSKKDLSASFQMNADISDYNKRERPPQEYYDEIKKRFAEERDLRLDYRPPGTEQYRALDGEFADYETDPYADEVIERDPIVDEVEVLFIGGGFSALLTSARLRQRGVESIRIVERGADVGGTWYWNRYPGVACDVVAYDYLPLLDEMDYVPTRHYAGGAEIFAHCQAIARKYDLYDLAVFQTTVTSTIWNEADQVWDITTDRGDTMHAKFVICANGTLGQASSGLDRRHGDLRRHVVPHVTLGLRLHRRRSREPGRRASRHHRHRRQRGADRPEPWAATPRSCTSSSARRRRSTFATTGRPTRTGPRSSNRAGRPNAARRSSTSPISGREAQGPQGHHPEEKIRRQENANIDAMMRIHRRIDETVEDPETAEALKPWYMLMCKRPCFHNDYLPTFNRPNVHLVDTKGKGITEIGRKGPIFDGVEYEVDLLIYATGFEVQQTGIYNRIVGEGGVDLNDKYADGIRTLLGIHSQGYPNLFIMGGYQASFQFNLTDLLQVQGDHIANCIDYVRSNDYDTIDVTRDAEEWWVQEVIAHRGKTNRNAGVHAGLLQLRRADNRRQDGNYNGGFPAYIDHIKAIEDDMDSSFVFTSG